CATVRDDIAVKAPLAAQDIDEQVCIAAARLAICSIVSAHDRRRVSFSDRGAKGRKIGFAQVALADGGVKPVALGLWAGMHGIVFGRGHSSQVLRIISL